MNDPQVAFVLASEFSHLGVRGSGVNVIPIVIIMPSRIFTLDLCGRRGCMILVCIFFYHHRMQSPKYAFNSIGQFCAASAVGQADPERWRPK